MTDRNVRDRTLVLRVLVPGLEARLRDKIKEAKETASRQQSLSNITATPTGRSTPNISSSSSSTSPQADVLQNLDGVTCEPTRDASTLWNFHCDGATYPAKLVNLPCPVELHKTHDHAMYYKSVDIAQMLIVYEDEMALEEADASFQSEAFPSYYHSGLTPPMKHVVEKRFEQREHKAIAPPRHEVSDVELDLLGLLDRISKDTAPTGRSKKKVLPTALPTKVIEEVVEDVVDYEPWMDDHGKQPYGIEFDDKDVLCTKHPELWLPVEEINAIQKAEREKLEEDAAAAAAIAAATFAKKKAKAEKKQKKKEERKGIASKKHVEQVDDVTAAATQMSHLLDPDEILGAALDDDFFNFGDDEALAGLEFQ